MAEGTFDDFEVCTEYAKKFTAAKTNEVIVAPPLDSAGNADLTRHYVIDFLMVTGDAAGSLQIDDNDNTAVDGYFWPYAANTHVKIGGKFLRKLGAGKGIRFTQTGGGNYSVIVKYHLAKVD